MARTVNFSYRRGGGSSLEIMFGELLFQPTLMHSVGTATAVIPAPTKADLIDGKATLTGVVPTPAPVGGMIEWAYKVTVKDRHGNSYEWLVGVPDGVDPIDFTSLPRYSETRPPVFGEGPPGAPGNAATVAVGTVVSGATPAVVNSGTPTNAVLDFTLAKGDKGDTGSPGAGVPVGGTALQVIRKSADNTTTEWATLPLATTSTDGQMPKGDKAKLDEATLAPVGGTLALRHWSGSLQVKTGASADDATSREFVEGALAVKQDKPEKLVWDKTKTHIATHRLGGSHMLQCTMAAAKANMAMGATTLDLDVRMTIDKTLLVAHDNYLIAETTAPAGTWETTYSTNTPGIQVKANIQQAGVWPNQPVSTVEDFFREFGDKAFIVVELKNILIGPYTIALDELNRLVNKYELKDSVIVSIYASVYSTHAALVKSRGFILQTYFDSAFPDFDSPSIIPTYTPLSDQIALSSVNSNSTISAWVATGKQIWCSPGGRQFRWAELQALGVKGMTDNTAIHAAGLGGGAYLSPYELGLWGNGDLPTLGDSLPTLLEAGGLRFNQSVADWQAMLMGDYSKLPGTYNLDFQVKFTTIVGGTPWFGFYICAPTDASIKWYSDPSPGGYQVTFHPKTGRLGLYKKVGGSGTTLISTPAGSTVTAGGTVYGRISVSPTSITLEQRTAFGGGSVITSGTTNDTTFRGSFTHAAQYGNGADATLERFKR